MSRSDGGGAWARIRQTIHDSSRLARVCWALAGLVLVLGPVVITLGRASSFAASVEAFPLSGASGGGNRAALTKVLDSPDLQSSAAIEAGGDVTSIHTSLIRSKRPNKRTFILTASGETPDQATRVVFVAGAELAARVTAGVQARAPALLTVLDDRIVSGTLSKAQTARAEEVVHSINRIQKGKEAALVLGPPTRPPLTRWGDRLVDRLPGSFPPRPSPLFAGLAGFVAWIGLSAAWLVVRTRRQVPPV